MTWKFDIDRVKDLFEKAFASVWTGEVENDNFNRLVLRAELGARDVTILRAYAKYLRQVGSTFSDAYIERALTGNPAIARKLLDLFLGAASTRRSTPCPLRRTETTMRMTSASSARNRCSRRSKPRSTTSPTWTKTASCASSLASSMQRYAPTISVKTPKGIRGLTCRSSWIRRRCRGLPEPRPMFEIWSTRRAWRACTCVAAGFARGGLRWSDRREDFRTEVLGLMKAQMVKNTVIVPVGSKGGFVVKNPPPPTDREGVCPGGRRVLPDVPARPALT